MARTVQEDLRGRVVVVTGANAGIGKETARSLAQMGAQVVMCARDPERGARAVAEVVASTGNDGVVLGDLDLASLTSVRRFAEWFETSFDRLDVLVNNAGLILDARRTTEDGFEMTFGVNHLGHFHLTDLLLPRLLETAPARVVTVSSVAHRLAVRGIDRSDLQLEGEYRSLAAYSRSKLANALFTLELARRLEGTGVTANCLHPGNIHSNLASDGDAGALSWWIKTFGPYVLRTPEAGAKTSVKLAASRHPSVVSSNGGYWSHGRRWRPSRAARRADAARWLWEESERLVAQVP
jgi:NAD(P)-dependent dehydrogenase (short-subunit alcohol dehydrogenase family)